MCRKAPEAGANEALTAYEPTHTQTHTRKHKPSHTWRASHAPNHCKRHGPTNCMWLSLLSRGGMLSGKGGNHSPLVFRPFRNLFFPLAQGLCVRKYLSYGYARCEFVSVRSIFSRDVAVRQRRSFDVRASFLPEIYLSIYQSSEFIRARVQANRLG